LRLNEFEEMLMKTENNITAADLSKSLTRFFEIADKKARLLDKSWDQKNGTPVFTVEGKYTTRGWTEWTQGFQYGWPILVFDATGENDLLELGRRRTVDLMAPHVTHTGVHDHGFNNLSTYGNLRRLMREGRIEHKVWENTFYEMAIKASGHAVAEERQLDESWLRLLVQRPAFAVRRHDENDSDLGRRVAARPQADARKRQGC
jgi:hypothetical protein